jgi:hypothetical protein
VRTSRFKKRASEAIKAVEGRLAGGVPRSTLVNAINRAVQMARKRDVIAHNPMMLGIYTNDAGEFAFKLLISPLRNEEVTMTLQELVALADEAARLLNHLFDAHRRVWRELNPVQPGDVGK